jgi:hypothetical protein
MTQSPTPAPPQITSSLHGVHRGAPVDPPVDPPVEVEVPFEPELEPDDVPGFSAAVFWHPRSPAPSAMTTTQLRFQEVRFMGWRKDRASVGLVLRTLQASINRTIHPTGGVSTLERMELD